jgi:hypothetical protein
VFHKRDPVSLPAATSREFLIATSHGQIHVVSIEEKDKQHPLIVLLSFTQKVEELKSSVCSKHAQVPDCNQQRPDPRASHRGEEQSTTRSSSCFLSS